MSLSRFETLPEKWLDLRFSVSTKLVALSCFKLLMNDSRAVPWRASPLVYLKASSSEAFSISFYRRVSRWAILQATLQTILKFWDPMSFLQRFSHAIIQRLLIAVLIEFRMLINYSESETELSHRRKALGNVALTKFITLSPRNRRISLVSLPAISLLS